MIQTRSRTLAVASLTALLVSAPAWADAPAGPGVGAPAPNFTLKDSEGQAFDLHAAMKTGTVVLAFFPKAFSAAGIAEWEALRDAAATFEKAGVQLVGLSTDAMSTLKRFRKAHKLPFRLLSDGDGTVSQTYGAVFGFEKRRLTAQKMVVVDRKGTVSYRDERYETKTDSDLKALLRAIGGD